MSTPSSVVVHSGAAVLADAAAARLVTHLVDAQSARGGAHLVLTGGTIGIAILSSLRESAARHAVDWRGVDIWWGDERFLPAGHAERNETQARAALLDHVRVDPARVHPMPASDGPDGPDVDAAAARYANELARHAGAANRTGVPRFDVLLLGLGPDAHVASLFPGQPALYEQERTVVGVHGSPKPPPLRISLTMAAINDASEVWFVVSGADKAPAVAMSMSDAGTVQVPAAGARGQHATRWLLDRAAASRIPASLTRLASP